MAPDLQQRLASLETQFAEICGLVAELLERQEDARAKRWRAKAAEWSARAQS
jgi:hypothetical protein